MYYYDYVITTFILLSDYKNERIKKIQEMLHRLNSTVRGN